MCLLQCVISHLGRVTRLVKRVGESLSDVIVRPFHNDWPQNAARWYVTRYTVCTLNRHVLTLPNFHKYGQPNNIANTISPLFNHDLKWMGPLYQVIMTVPLIIRNITWSNVLLLRSPLECNESGCFSMASDVAMIAFCILQVKNTRLWKRVHWSSLQKSV